MNFPWGHSRRFNAYSNHFRSEFGYRVQKLSLDAGFTCPNRDGTKGTGGCTYCNNSGFNPSYCSPEKSISWQLEEGILFHQWRYKKALKYIAYFQAYTNTYAPLQTLKALYEEALSFPGVIGLVIGTRPDCVEPLLLDYLAELSRKHYLVVEYGIESCYDDTLRLINRGHTWEEAASMVSLTAGRGIRTGAHLIFGLPGETKAQMLAEAPVLSGLPLTSIKFHQLQVLKNTVIADEYDRDPGRFAFFTLEEYCDFIVDFLERLNPSFVVERFAGEVPPRFLHGPGWGLIRNEQLISRIEKRLVERETWQGRLFS